MRGFRPNSALMASGIGRLGRLGDASGSPAQNTQGPGEQVWNPSGAQLPQGQPDWYTYSVTFLALAAFSGGNPGAAQTQSINIDASADFFWCLLSYQAVGTYGTSTYTQSSNPVPLVKVNITDGGSSKNLSAFPVFINSIAGTGGWPYGLRHPRYFARQSLVSITAQSFDSATIAEFTMYFGGFRIYPIPSA